MFDTNTLGSCCIFLPLLVVDDKRCEQPRSLDQGHEFDHEYHRDHDNDWYRVASSSSHWWMTNDVSNLEASSNGGALLPFKSRTWAALNHNLVLLHNHTTNKINLQIFAMKLYLLFQTAWVPSRKPVGEGEDVEGVRQAWPSWKHSLPLLLPFCK